MIKLIIILITLFIVYRLCKISSDSDNKELEDEIFINTYKKDDEN